MATHEIRVDYSRPLTQEPEKGHNRWHPDIPPVVRCRPGDEVVMETRDALDLQITKDSSPEDVGAVNLNVVHPLTGPVQAHPEAVVELAGGIRREVLGRAAVGEDRERLWQRWRELDQNLDGYAARRPRETAVVVLEPHAVAE